MANPHRRATLRMLLTLAAIPLARPLAAQSGYPTKPIKIIAPVQPGGGVDLVARTIADRLGRVLGAVDHRRQPERRRRRRRLARDRARGARRLHADGRLRRHARHQSGGAQAALRRGQGLHADRDGRRHAERPRRAAVAAGDDACRIHRLREGEPGKLSYGSSGPGTLTHLAMEQLKVAADLDMVARSVSRHRPGDHRHPRRPDAGDVPRTRRRAAAHQGGQDEGRSPSPAPSAIRCLPDVPTFEELGYKGFDGVQWYGIVGPANLPAPIVKRLNEEINKLLAIPGLARAAVRRGARADADVAGAVRPVHARRHRALEPRSRRNATSRFGTDHALARHDRMAHNTQVTADAHAPAVTQILADFVATHPSRGWSDGVEHEAHRTFLNWVGCAIGASRHPTVAAALAAVQELAPGAQATILGRGERVDMAQRRAPERHHVAHVRLRRHASQDDHPSGAGRSPRRRSRSPSIIGSSGRELIDALVLGIDVACRVGNMIYPDHYDRGWHITGSTGMLGAAAACARLLGLDARKTTMALGHRGVAADRRARAVRLDDQAVPSGRRGARGPHVGAVGEARLHRVAARDRGAARPRADVLDQVRLERDHRRARQRFEISFNTYKPFACGIVIHPSDRRLRAAAQRARPRARRTSRASSSACIRWCSSSPARTRRAPGSRASSASITRAPRASCSDRPAKRNSPTPSSRAPT